MISTDIPHRNRWSCFLVALGFAAGVSNIGQNGLQFDTPTQNFNSTSCVQTIVQSVALASVFFTQCSAVYHLLWILGPVNSVIHFFCLKIKLL